MMYGISGYFPELGLRCGSEKELRALGAKPGKYICMGLVFSTILGFLFSIFMGATWFPLISGLLLGFFIILPKMEMKRVEGQIESELPWFLRGAGMLLELGIPFGKALEYAAEGRVRREICGALKGPGGGVQDALSSFGGRYRSLAIKRAASQLSLCYESGGSGKEIIRIGEDMLALHKHRLRESSSKSALIGLLFIMTSIVIPTFFLVYASAGSYAFGSTVSKEEISIAMLLLFPMMSVFVLVLSRGLMPAGVQDGRGFDFTVLVPAAIAVAGVVLAPSMAAVFLAAGTAAGAVIVARTYPKERAKEEIERRLPDALLSIGNLPKSSRMDDIFRIIGRGGFGALSKEAQISQKQLKMNVRSNIVLDDLWKRNGSQPLKRASMMLGRMFETSSLERMGLLADDMIASAEIRRERARLFSMQKYTLILGAAIMPLIMGMMMELFEGLEGGAEIPSDTITGYIIIYAAISSSAISWFEGKKSSAAIYMALLAATALIIFHFLSF